MTDALIAVNGQLVLRQGNFESDGARFLEPRVILRAGDNQVHVLLKGDRDRAGRGHRRRRFGVAVNQSSRRPSSKRPPLEQHERPGHLQDALIEFVKSMQVLPQGTMDLIVDEHHRPRSWRAADF